MLLLTGQACSAELIIDCLSVSQWRSCSCKLPSRPISGKMASPLRERAHKQVRSGCNTQVGRRAAAAHTPGKRAGCQARGRGGRRRQLQQLPAQQASMCCSGLPAQVRSGQPALGMADTSPPWHTCPCTHGSQAQKQGAQATSSGLAVCLQIVGPDHAASM